MVIFLFSGKNNPGGDDSMMMGRDVCGLPVFSWAEGCYLGRVSDFFIHIETKSFLGISLGKKFPGKMRFISRGHIHRIYKDGVIVSSSAAIRFVRSLGESSMSYLDFSKDTSIFLREGETVSDLIFGEAFDIDGYEISGGLWNDLVRGRTFRPRPDKIKQISK